MHTEMGAAFIPVHSAGKFPPPTSAELLCDELLDHTFLCETCINGREDVCPTYIALKKKVDEAGGITKGVILTM